MAIDEDERRRSDELDRILNDELDGYGPPTDEELRTWRESAPHPSEAVEYDSAETEAEGSTDD